MNCKHYARHVIKVNTDTFARSENLRLEKTQMSQGSQGSVGTLSVAVQLRVQSSVSRSSEAGHLN